MFPCLLRLSIGGRLRKKGYKKLSKNYLLAFSKDDIKTPERNKIL